MRTLVLFVCGLGPAGALAEAASEEAAAVSQVAVSEYVQVWLGTTDAEESWSLADGAGAELVGNYDDLPLGGGVGQRLLGSGFVQYGFEGGGLVSWQNDSVEYAGGSPGLIVAVNADLFLIDAFMGGVFALRPARWMRVYVAGGPSIAYTHIDGEGSDDSGSTVIVAGPNSFIEIDTTDDINDFSFAPYARAGVEFEFDAGFTVGASVRYADHEFDLDELGKLQLDEVQWFLTLGARF